ncbi:MAG: hypothetical protein ACR2OA_00625 [Rubripirellula sp.]
MRSSSRTQNDKPHGRVLGDAYQAMARTQDRVATSLETDNDGVDGSRHHRIFSSLDLG